MALQYLKSRKGNPQLLFDGFRYVLERTRNGKRNWKCAKYDRELCRGRCQSKDDSAWLTADHNHPPTHSNSDTNTDASPAIVSPEFSGIPTPQKQLHNASTQPVLEDFIDEVVRQYYSTRISSAGSYIDSSADAHPEVKSQSNPGPHGSTSSYTDDDKETNMSENYKSTLEHTSRKPIPPKFRRSSTAQKQFHNASTQTEQEHFNDLSDTSYSTDSGDKESNKSYTSDEESSKSYTSDSSDAESNKSYTSASSDEGSSVIESNQTNLLDNGLKGRVNKRIEGMYNRMRKSRPWVDILVNAHPRHRKKVLQLAGTELIDSVAEFCNSILNSSVPMSGAEKSCLIQYKRIIRKIADPRTKTSAKIRILQSKPDFIAPLLTVVDKFLLKNGFDVPLPFFNK
jgi:hypothetical protein